MGAIGCGLMFTGLLLGALTSNILILLIAFAIGMLFVYGAKVQEHIDEQQEQAWRKRYPDYRY